MKKIAIFVNDLNIGGIQKSVINLINYVDSNKYQIDIYTFSDKVFYEVPSNVKITRLESAPKYLKFIPFNLAIKLYKEKITDEEYDVSIDFDSYQFSTAYAALTVKSKKKVIWVHNDIKMKAKEEFKYKVLYTFFKGKYKHFDVYCAVSEGALETFKELHKYYDKKYMCIPNYINTNEIKNKMEEIPELIVDKSLVNIVTLGRLCHQKGIDIMLYNIKELSKYRSDFHLYIIGDGEDRKKLTKLASTLEIKNKVTFLGSTNNPFKYLKIMDLFYLQSRYEGQGMVILEALSVGLDVLIPDYLEKYCPLVTGSPNVLESLKKYVKTDKEKVFNSLSEYNNEITLKLDELFEGSEI